MKKQDNVIIGIYKITNPKGKIYIGQSIDLFQRSKDYKYKRCKQQYKLYNSILKYGWEQHRFEIIEECNLEQLNEKEIYWITFFNSINEGLNLKEGGSFGKHSQETKNKISKANKGKKFPQEVREKMGLTKGFKYDEKTKEKMSQSLKGKPKPSGFGEKISKANMGKIKSDETIQKMRDSNPNKKAILQINPETYKIINEFSSMKEAGRILNINPSGITEVIKGRQKTSSGYIWKLK